MKAEAPGRRAIVFIGPLMAPREQIEELRARVDTV